ncbi:helicase-related protein, partial [Candidatus Marinimicrobia bacterium]|nr:helicase-related protein [Candidatus Neomarinimicrobiota bacterium]
KFVDGKILLDVKYLDKISFFSPASSEEETALDSMNKTGAWKRKKKQSYEKAREFVESMVDSYVQRDVYINKKLTFDEELFALFLSSFPYVDTQDQASVWENIKKDLCGEKPMHRLLCGDVGFGKTEIAMRAAFLLCLNNEQTLVLAPTTILCEQLYSCFKERFCSFGVKTERISRLTKKNAQHISLFLENKIDILIGTHAILKNEKLLRKASLIVVDEEHRFGVKDKEKILGFSPGCHYLSMSATPIPRSLQLSLSGVRNISTLLTAPKSRKPIITNVLYFSKQLIKTIVLSEVSRGGQVYIVDNSVNNVKNVCGLISSLFPEFSISFLHGSLDKKTINSIMSLFRLKKINVLVSTVIIESGIDIPSANTIIINNAHMFGLSQLHQLRGRVGRSNVQSYAYMLIPKAKNITKDGVSRLKSIKKHSSLGAGYNLAVEDLQIRGAGNLFGYNQSGQSFVGFEYYTKLLSRAMKNVKYKGLNFQPAEISLGECYIPRSFIPIEEERAFYYKSIFECLNVESLSSLLKKTIKLFGPLPEDFLLLFKTKELSLFCEPTPIVSIIKNEAFFIIYCSSLGLVDIEGFISKLGSFFDRKDISYTLKPDSSLLKIQFKYIAQDSYILLENFIKNLYD